MTRTIAYLAAAGIASAADWPQFRGPAASGIGTGNPPLEWNTETGKNVLWKREIPGLAHSSPIVWGARIFLTSAVPAKGESALKLGLYGDVMPVEGEGPQSFNVYCVERKTGKILWERTAISGQPKIKRHPKSTHANPTPATDGKHVVASFGSEGLFVYDFEGNLLWKKNLGVLDSGFFRVPEAQWGFASSPIIHERMVIVQADVQKDSFLAAFDVGTGRELWRTPRKEAPTFSTPTAIGTQIVVNGWKEIAGYDSRTGKRLWQMEGAGDIPVPTPVSADGLIVLTSAHGGGRPIYALRPDGTRAWSQERAGNYMQTPVLDGGLGYFCFDNGVLTVFQLRTGEQVYQQRLGGGGSGFSSSPVAAAGRLYITNEEGRTYVLALGARHNLLAENELGEAVMATPAIVDGVLYIRGRKHLFAIGAR